MPNPSFERTSSGPLNSIVRRPHRLARFFTAASTHGSCPPAHGAAPQVISLGKSGGVLALIFVFCRRPKHVVNHGNGTFEVSRCTSGSLVKLCNPPLSLLKITQRAIHKQSPVVALQGAASAIAASCSALAFSIRASTSFTRCTPAWRWASLAGVRCAQLGNVRRPHRLARFFTAASTHGSCPPAHGAAPQIGLARRIARLVVAHPSLYSVCAHVPSAKPPGHQINRCAKSASNSHVQPPAPNSALKRYAATRRAAASSSHHDRASARGCGSGWS